MSQQANNLMKSIYLQRFSALIPTIVKWFQKKQTFFEEVVNLQRQSMTAIQKCGQITINLLVFIIDFLKEQKDSNSKVVDSKDSNNLFKAIQKHKTKKQNVQQGKILTDIQQWNAPALKYFNELTESALQQKICLKKFQGIIQQILQKFIDEEDNYRSLLKKSFKGINRRYQQLEQNSKNQKKIILKYYDNGKKFNKQTLTTISQIKEIQSLTYKQITILVTRSIQIRQLIQKVISEQKRLMKLFKDLFTKYMNGYQAVYKQSNHFLALYKIIQKIQAQQQNLKINYFNKYISSQKTIKQIKQITKVKQKQNYQTFINFLNLTQKDIASLIKIQKTMNQFLDYLISRKWKIQLSQGWIIQTWNKCLGCITLDFHFVLFDKNNKMIKVINAKESKLENKEDCIAFVTEQVKGIFTNSKQQYKIRFENYDNLEQFELYLNNQLK